MKSLAKLLVTVLEDLQYSTCDTDLTRDSLTVLARVKDEGDSFATITLPAFAQDFERSLELGRIDPTSFLHFKKKKGSCVPEFLQGHMLNVFHPSGPLLKDPDPKSVFAIRQICLFAKRISRDCTPFRKEEAVNKFLECEQELKRVEDICPLFFDAYGKVCDIVLSDITDYSFYESLKPTHGPGVTADRVFGNQKFCQRQWTTRLEDVFPYTEFATASVRNLMDPALPVEFLEPGEELPVKVTLVPKTLKTPRIIAIEPSCNQFMQQGLMRWIVPRIEKGRYTGGRVNFTRQSVNQDLARASSVSRENATLDLSEASDRVSYDLAKRLYRVHPHLWECIDACRSTRAKLPSGKVIALKKFASMGSAMCFPTEALVFFCTIVAARIHNRGLQVTASRVKHFSRDVYIYGDDIIVPSDEVSCVVQGLEATGLKVNSRKSFSRGSFRESCGGEYFMGKSVKPIYLRRDLPERRTDASRLISTVSTANQLFDAGLWRTATLLKDAVECHLGKLPSVHSESYALGWYGISNHLPKIRFNKKLQRREFLSYGVKVKRIEDEISDDPALAKCFRTVVYPNGSLLNLSQVDEKHLLESVRPRDLALSRMWACATSLV